MVTRDSGCVCSTGMAGGGEDSRAVEEKGTGLARPEEEEEAALPARKAAEPSGALASALVVSDSGCACSEWVAAGAAGDARAAEGVAGESSMLPCDDAGLAHGFSAGRYGTHGFLLLEEAVEDGDAVSGRGRGDGGDWKGGYSLSASWLCC